IFRQFDLPLLIIFQCGIHAFIYSSYSITLLPGKYLRVGANLTVQCVTISAPAVTEAALRDQLRVRWSSKNRLIYYNCRAVNETAFEWTLTSVAINDSGIFQCVNISHDSHTESAHAELFVGEPPKLTGLDCEWPNRESENFRCLSRPNLRSVWEATNIVKTAGKVHLVLEFADKRDPFMQSELNQCRKRTDHYNNLICFPSDSDSSTGFEYRRCLRNGAPAALSVPSAPGCQCNSEGRCRWLRVARPAARCGCEPRAATGWAGAAAGSQWRATGGSLVRKRPGLVRSLRLFALNGSVVAKFSPPTQPDPASKRDYECRLRLRPWLDGARIGPVASETVENSTVRLSARARGRETYTAEVSCRPKYFRLPGNSGWSEPAEAKISTPVWPPCPPRLALLLERRNFVWLSAPPAELQAWPIVSYRLRLGGGGAGRNSSAAALVAELPLHPAEPGGGWIRLDQADIRGLWAELAKVGQCRFCWPELGCPSVRTAAAGRRQLELQMLCAAEHGRNDSVRGRHRGSGSVATYLQPLTAWNRHSAIATCERPAAY
uniref:Ig-like domain-containing protein n=1 Tax=Macrostomum lignano TaxID=282301 RepID=A0A1I8FMC2_9PLAT